MQCDGASDTASKPLALAQSPPGDGLKWFVGARTPFTCAFEDDEAEMEVCIARTSISVCCRLKIQASFANWGFLPRQVIYNSFLLFSYSTLNFLRFI